MSLFTSEFFVNNRAQLRKLFLGTAPIVLTANGILQRNSDVTYPFRQDSSFWYFTGLDIPDLVLVIDKEREYLILPYRHSVLDTFNGALRIDEIKERSGIEEVLSDAEGWKRLGGRIKRALHVAIVPPPSYYIPELNLYPNPARERLKHKIKTYNSDVEFLDIREHVTKLRQVKQPVEIDAMQKAVNVTMKTLTKIKKNISKFDFEFEIDALILFEYKSNNLVPAYESIVASGNNANTMHYFENNSLLNGQDFVLLDIGADYENYSADLTRTYALNNKPSKRLRDVHDSVKEVQDYAMSLVKSGMILKDYETTVAQYMGEKLRELGLIKSIDEESVRKYFPTLTSHFLGLDTHDVGEYDKPLPENSVITVEPGIYIPEEGIGVRIEDDVVVTKDGFKNLSADLSSALL